VPITATLTATRMIGPVVQVQQTHVTYTRVMLASAAARASMSCTPLLLQSSLLSFLSFLAFFKRPLVPAALVVPRALEPGVEKYVGGLRHIRKYWQYVRSGH
jgi:hypothetical protein